MKRFPHLREIPKLPFIVIDRVGHELDALEASLLYRNPLPNSAHVLADDLLEREDPRAAVLVARLHDQPYLMVVPMQHANGHPDGARLHAWGHVVSEKDRKTLVPTLIVQNVVPPRRRDDFARIPRALGLVKARVAPAHAAGAFYIHTAYPVGAFFLAWAIPTLDRVVIQPLRPNTPLEHPSPEAYVASLFDETVVEISSEPYE